MIGFPSLSAIQPGDNGTLSLDAKTILLPATEVIAASKTKSGNLSAGAEYEIGLVPNARTDEYVGTILGEQAAIVVPIMSYPKQSLNGRLAFQDDHNYS